VSGNGLAKPCQRPEVETRKGKVESTGNHPVYSHDNATQFVNHQVGRLDGLGVVIHMDRVAIFKGSAKGWTRSHTEKHAKNMLAFLVEVDGDGKIVLVCSEPVSAVRR